MRRWCAVGKRGCDFRRRRSGSRVGCGLGRTGPGGAKGKREKGEEEESEVDEALDDSPPLDA